METTDSNLFHPSLEKTTSEFGYNNFIKVNGLKRKRLMDENRNGEILSGTGGGCKRKFIHFIKDCGVYQTDILKQSKDGDTIYLPLAGDVFVNIDHAEEITFTEGIFFVGDANGKYCSSVGGTAMHIWKYSDTKQQMLISRSFLITDQMVFNGVKDLLLRMV